MRSKDVTANEPKLMAGADTSQVNRPQSSAGGAAGMAARQLPHGPEMPMQWQQQKALQAQPPAPASTPAPAKQEGANLARQIPPASQTVEVAGAATQINTQTQNLESQVRGQSAEAQPSGEEYAARVGKAKPAVKAQVAGGVASAPTVASAGAKMDTMRPYAAPRWTITPAGGLQRSFDQGNTWQDVEVNAIPSASASLTSLEVVAKASRAKERELDKKALKGPAAAPIFRAVAATEAEVWAGGSDAALYHSLDAGAHWTRVVPSSAGAILSGDIVSLEFSDSQHGKITTSTPEIWTTGNDGQTWEKQ